MKSITLKAGEKDLLKLICEQSPDGVTIEQVRSAIRVMDKIDAMEADSGLCTDILLLEDSDHQFLVGKFSTMKFVKADRGILDLFDRLSKAVSA